MAELDLNVTNQYYDDFVDTLNKIAPENLNNYNETNFADDLGTKKVIIQRLWQVEQKMKHSKQALTMFSGNSVGSYLPVMVVYTAKNVYPNWSEDGP